MGGERGSPTVREFSVARVAEVCFAEECPAEVRPVEVRPDEVPAEIGVDEVCPAEIAFGDVDWRKIPVLLDEPCF
jgi:hypothetical protein